MKVAFVTSSLSRLAGGIFEIERDLASAMSARGDTIVKAFGPADQYIDEDRALWDCAGVHAYPIAGPPAFGYSRDLPRLLAAEDADVGHLHSLWMYPSIAIRSWAYQHRRAYVVTPNGMLEPWALANSRWKKRVALALYERRTLTSAACIQANTEKELHDVRAFGLRNPVAVIPNGVHLPPADDGSPPQWAEQVPDARKVLLFLGRLHPKKGLVNLVRGFALAGRRKGPASRDWTLVIAGWDQGGHRRALEGIVAEEGIERQVRFIGPQFGANKAATLRRADSFVLPSFSEGLPMAVLEAWAFGKPVVMTPACNLPEGFAQGAALSTGYDATSVGCALEELFSMSCDDLAAMGARGRRLAETRFSWAEVAARLREVYAWVAAEAPRPDCIVLDEAGVSAG
ncbi:hypothetical protein CKO31_21805 [Thiohalocapsa halophila]|uniref:Glycosyltransferase n=1 Tax=Thiohalocapsa halophila TaxID=69359 RepID=A0ABS1CNB1_9GAMM|nr:glycosyltransferase [Thiohalocapsa halophila]MBK1633338.1 hypothetical protein [Thiohalocapsa halophila]